MPEPPPQDEDERLGPVVALVVMAVLAALALALVFYLHREGDREDCLLAGRRDCDHLSDGP